MDSGPPRADDLVCGFDRKHHAGWQGGFERSLQQELSELLGRLGEGEALAGPVVELIGDGVELGLGDRAEVGALREVVPEQPVGRSYVCQVVAGSSLGRVAAWMRR